MKDLVEYIAKSLVDHPDQVEVTQVRAGNTTIIKLNVASSDKGWVIGRRGRVANAMRTLLHVASSVRDGRRTILKIV